MNFCHLHIHDQFSLLDGVGTCETYVAKAKSLGFEYLACTNHANINGLIKFQKCCVENEIKPILGCEMYIVEDFHNKVDKEKRGHILVLVKDAAGWQNLTKMLSIANMDGFYYKPRIDYKTLLDHSEGLIISTACAASFIYNNNGEEFFKQLAKNNEDFYLEIMPINYEGQVKHNKKILSLKRKFPQLKLIATNDCHYPNHDDSKVQEVLLAIQTKVKWNDPKRWKFETTDLFLKSKNEMLESFKKNHSYIDNKIIEEALENTIDVAKKCNFLIARSEVFFPNIVDDARKYIEDYCYNNFQLKIKENKGKYRKRLLYELDMLEKLGFLQYFIIIQDIVLWCKNKNIFIGVGRGSVGASLIAFLLEITRVDPIKHDLMFERFISPDRIDVPDIDIDFEDVKRKEVRTYLENKYGKYNIASVSTFLQMKSKMVFRDVCRVFDVPLAIVNSIAKNIDDSKELIYSSDQREDNKTSGGISTAISSTSEGIEFRKKYLEIEEICNKLNGQVRGIGKHAAAAIITREDLRYSDRCNLTKKENAISINWDKKDAEYVGMLKVDILGLSNLSMIHFASDLIKEKHGIDIDFNSIDLKDKKVLKEFSLGNCIGIFQFGTYGLRNLCKDLRADSFELLTFITALYRPSSLRSGMVDKFKLRRAGKESCVHDNPLDEILLETYGIILFQEQVMQIAHRVAGMSFTDADKIRKLLDKEDRNVLNEKYMRPFIKGCMSKGIERITAIEIWDQLLLHGNYGFNKSHATGYTILSFSNMFLKVYFPIEFMCASLTHTADNKKDELIEETKRLGIKIMTPKIGISHSTKWVSKRNTIFMPFIDIHGIGVKGAEKLSSMKQESFFDENIEIKGKMKSMLVEIDAHNEKNISKSKLIPFSL
uniref:Putative DNA polymerase n=1 Tax=viral metagenome TaxID=1070528 RepID=A0A6M3M3Y1_9ZZZZ